MSAVVSIQRMQSLHDKLKAAAPLCWGGGARLVVAVSGGPDSQALLDALACERDHLGIGALFAVGVDHGLRPAAADELRLARDLATRHGVPFTQIAVQVTPRGNRLENARAARYAALEQVAHDLKADAIAVAHTATDQLETILLHLTRGSALRGVAGMAMRRGLLVRPLLNVTRDEVLAYTAARHLPYAQDPSNVDPCRARAHLRATVLPALRQLNPRVETHAARFAERAQADERFLQQKARRAFQKALRPAGGLDVSVLEHLPHTVAWRVLRTWLAHHDLRLDAAAMERLWAARTRPTFALSCAGRVEVRLEHQTFWCVRATPYNEPLVIPGEQQIKQFPVHLRSSVKHVDRGTSWRQIVAPTAEKVAFDADRLHFGLRIRAWQRGDRLQPLGFNGHIKVGDLFTNAKIPRSLRATWPLLVHGEEVLWVVGLRRGSGASLSNETRRVVTVELGGALPWSAC